MFYWRFTIRTEDEARFRAVAKRTGADLCQFQAEQPESHKEFDVENHSEAVGLATNLVIDNIEFEFETYDI